MKKTIIILGMLIFGLTISGVANAVTINDPWVPNGTRVGEENLYQIYNNLAGTGFANSGQLTQLSQPGPWSAGDWKVNVVVKFAGLNQTLGTTGGAAMTPYTATTNGYTNVNTAFTATGTFKWTDTTTLGTQDSDSNQFVAFQLTQAQIDWYNENIANGDDIPFKSGDVYLLGFEDTPTGDRDFNDLVALVEVDRPDNVVPEPATMLLLGSGLIGLAGFARRRFRK